MYPLSDKDLDRLSREAAEQTDVDQRPSGWEKLEQRLDIELPREEKRRRRFLWFFFLFLLTSGTGLVWLLAQSNETTKTKTIAANTIKKELSSAPATSSSNEATTQPRTENIKESSSLPDDHTTITAAPTLNENTNVIETQEGNKNSDSKQTTGVDKSNQLANDRNRSAEGNHKKSSGNKSTVKLNSTSSSRMVPSASGKGNKKTTNNNKTATEDIHNPTEIVPVNKQEDLADSIEAKEAPASSPSANPSASLSTKASKADSVNKPVVLPASAIAKKQEKKQINKNPFAIGIVTGVDYSRINGTGKNKMGYDLGVQLSYNITPRLSVNTGFVFTKKFYKTTGDNFHPPKHYFTYYVEKLNWVDGNCYMWDIPLNIRYDIVSGKTTRWFVSAGASSYIMRNQAYIYDYVYNSTPTQRDWSTSSQQNEWFKILNLSAGLEKNIGKSFSIQAEPFIKLPMSGVGFGKMDLTNYGLLLGLKYRPQFKK